MQHKYIWAMGLSFISAIAFAEHKGDYDCSDFDPGTYSHCTHFVIEPPLPAYIGYYTRIYYEFDGMLIGPMPDCRNSKNQLNFYMENEPGIWKEIVEIGYIGNDGNLYYETHAEQIFNHTGLGLASPAIHSISIDSTRSYATCDPSLYNANMTISIAGLKLNLTHNNASSALFQIPQGD